MLRERGNEQGGDKDVFIYVLFVFMFYEINKRVRKLALGLFDG